jgi:hypothetical protein
MSSRSLTAAEETFQGFSPAHFCEPSPSNATSNLPSTPIGTEDSLLGNSFDRVREFLSTGVADSRITWLEAAAPLVADMRNGGVRLRMETEPFSSDPLY